MNDHDYIEMALAEAEMAAERGEVPVGAVLLGPDGAVLARTGNRIIELQDPTAHAEILALRRGCGALGNERLIGTTLYVTLEPCAMCAGAVVHARIGRVVYGAPDPKAGAAGGVFNLLQSASLNHRAEVIGGVMSDECGRMLQQFFQRRRGA